MKKINKRNKLILIIILISFSIISYGIYFYNSNIYEEFEQSEKIQELIPYEEEIQNTENNEKNNKNIKDEKNTEDEIIIIHITGAIKNWGIIELPKNSRIADAIEKAGGLTEDADVNKINLAFVLEDGMKIKIPSINEETSNDYTEKYITKESGEDIVASIGNATHKEEKQSIVNINTASQTELETLPGIGTSTALKIINYRNENGKFQNVEEIKNVNGIGEAKFENIKDLICT